MESWSQCASFGASFDGIVVWNVEEDVIRDDDFRGISFPETFVFDRRGLRGMEYEAVCLPTERLDIRGVSRLFCFD